MKVDKLKKEKSPQLKSTTFKKLDSKKNINKKEETHIPKSTALLIQPSPSPMVTAKTVLVFRQAPNRPNSSTPPPPVSKTHPKPALER